MVLKEVPPNSTVVGVPGRVVKRNNERLPQNDLDQVNLPDPILKEIKRLRKECNYLQEALVQVAQAGHVELPDRETYITATRLKTPRIQNSIN